MSGEHPSTPLEGFIAVARREGWLAPDLADTLFRESADRQLPPAQVAMQKGMLSLVQIEIIETLLNPRQTIKGYEILGLLGYGGMGVVYRARQLSLGRIVALKTVMLGMNANPNRLSRFEQEAQTVGKLLHPHIITAYDFGQDGGRLYFAMELVEGEDVEQRIDRDGPISEAMTWGLIRQAASGLAQAAELGVVHRDIKPANLLLVAPPKGFPLPAGMSLLKIADFGLALITDDVDDRTRLTADNSTVGSPHYMAPEQLGQSDIDHRADIYALGATAYHMLTGRPPFDGLSLPQIFSQKLNGEPAPLTNYCTGLSLETVALIDDLLARDPAQRIDSYATLIDRIDELLPVSQVKPLATARPKRTVTTETRRLGETLTGSEALARQNPPAKPRSTGNRFFEFGWRFLVAVLLLGGTYYGINAWRQKTLATVVRPGMELIPSGYGIELFDGKSLFPWRPMGGNWQTAQDDEGAIVIAASHGVIQRKIQREDPNKPPERIHHFRLRFNAALRQATAIELSFGIHLPKPDVEARTVLRWEKDRVILGRQTSVSAVEPAVPPVALALEPNRYHEIRIERQASEWKAFIDDRFIGAAPLAAEELRYIRLAVVAASDEQLAYFADFLVEELVPPR